MASGEELERLDKTADGLDMEGKPSWAAAEISDALLEGAEQGLGHEEACDLCGLWNGA